MAPRTDLPPYPQPPTPTSTPHPLLPRPQLNPYPHTPTVPQPLLPHDHPLLPHLTQSSHLPLPLPHPLSLPPPLGSRERIPGLKLRTVSDGGGTEECLGRGRREAPRAQRPVWLRVQSLQCRPGGPNCRPHLGLSRSHPQPHPLLRSPGPQSPTPSARGVRKLRTVSDLGTRDAYHRRGESGSKTEDQGTPVSPPSPQEPAVSATPEGPDCPP